MSTSLPADWYDDPDDPKAERWWDGHEWSPNRRRKHAMSPKREPPASPPTYSATAPGEPATAPQSDIFATSYPAFAYDYPSSGFDTGPAESLATPSDAAGVRSGFGVPEAIALLLALCGLALVASAFGTWGRVREAAYVAGNDLTFSATFPGVGNPSRRGRLSDGTGTLEVVSDEALKNTNPGWIALALGVVLLAAGIAYYLAWNRKFVGAIAAAFSTAVLVVCIGYLIDVRGAFDDPLDLAVFEFSPGLGLISATALAAFVAVLGAVAFVIEWRSESASR